MPRRRSAPDPGWREVLQGLAPPEDATAAGEQPLALGVDLLTGFGGFGFSRFGAASADLQDVRDDAPLAVALRPLRPGAKPGTWVRGSLTWKRFRYAGAGSTAPLAGHRPAHAEILGRLVRLFLAEHAFGSDPGDVLRLDEFRGPDAWALLAAARDAGIELIGTGIVSGVELTAPAHASLDLRRLDGGMGLWPRIEVGDEVIGGLTAAGPGGFFGVLPDADGRGVRVRLVPAASAVPAAVSGLLTRADPLRIPAADAEEFLADLAPQLREHVVLRAEDPSLHVPEQVPARLVGEVSYGPEGAVDLRWSWEYRAPRRSVPLARPTHAPGRDARREDDVLAAVRAAGQDAPEAAPGHDTDTSAERGTGMAEDPALDLATEPHQRLSGMDGVRFVEETLPRLLALPGVEIREDGDRPVYTERTGTPHLRITQVEPPNAHAHDWFELGFMITLGEHLVPFTAVFSALSRRQRSVLLPDDTYFRLDHPTFDRLREVIAEAEALGEWEPGSPAVSRHALDLWEDFEDVADEAVEAVAWRSGVGALRDLAEIPVPPLPAGLRATLRPYQAEGYAWLDLLRAHGLGGILADDMGLGKTLQALAMIARARELDPAAPPFLVVAPSSVLSVWRSESERFTPDLDVRVLDTTTAVRASALADAVRGADVVVTSYALLRLDADDHTALDWSGLILDEAQFVKNPASRVHEVAGLIRAPFRLAITGTPLENSLTDLWALLALTAPGLFASRRAFRDHYARPIEKPDPSDSGRRRAEERMTRLRRRIRPFVLRRTKEVVAPELPEKQEQVVRVPLLPAHRRLYERILQRERQKLLGLVEDIDRNRFIVFRSLTLLRMLALDPSIVDPEHEGVPSSKLEATLERLDEVIADQHRVLVFSQFTSHLDHVAERLQQRGIAAVRLDGSTTRRERVVASFREGDAPVFLISLKAGGFGLTLTEADYVFLLDPWWNPAAEAQAIDRTHRIGQDSAVMVYRMVAEGTIEEKVLALQERKRALFSSLTDDGEAFSGAITAEDVRMLLDD